MPVGFQFHAMTSEMEATPFRLPKITPREDGSEHLHHHTYTRLNDRGDESLRWKYPLTTKSFRAHAGPNFRKAMIAPAAPATTPKVPMPAQRPHPQANRLLQHQMMPQQHTMQQFPYWHNGHLDYTEGPSPSPSFGLPHHDLHASSPASVGGLLRRSRTTLTQSQGMPRPQFREATILDGSSGRVDWVMSTHRHFYGDKKGQQKNQGPFSREFTVHVMAPTNWLKMKLGKRVPRTEEYVAMSTPVYYTQHVSSIPKRSPQLIL